MLFTLSLIGLEHLFETLGMYMYVSIYALHCVRKLGFVWLNCVAHLFQIKHTLKLKYIFRENLKYNVLEKQYTLINMILKY